MDKEPTAKLVPVMVPVEHLSSVYALLGRLLTLETAEEGDHDERSVYIDSENGRWSESELAMLAVILSGTVLQKVVGAIAEISPNLIAFSQLASHVNLDRDMLRAQLATLTKHARKANGGRKSWPFTAKWVGSEMAYSMPIEAAEMWHECEMVLAEAGEARRPPSQ